MKAVVRLENPNKNSLDKYIQKNANYLMKCFTEGTTTKTETQICLIMKALKKSHTKITSRLQWSLIKRNAAKTN